MAILKEIASKAKYIKSVVDYVKKDAKTEGGLYVEGVNCDPQKAVSEFLDVQRLWNKTDGRKYFHYIMSWDSKEAMTPSFALYLAKNWIKRIPKLKGHQILLAAHIDQKHGNIHVHIVGNSVNMETGVKLHRNAAELTEWKKVCNEVNIEWGHLPPRQKTRAEKSKNPTTWTKEEYQAQEKAHTDGKRTCKEQVMDAILAAYSEAKSKESFISMLAKKNITVVWKASRKHITFELKGYEGDTSKTKIRDSNIEKTFGFSCSKEALEAKFEQNLQKQRDRVKAIREAAKQGWKAEADRIAAQKNRNRSQQGKDDYQR